MSAAGNAGIGRRSLLKGLVGIAGLIMAAAAAFELPRLLGPHYPPTPYDDLLALLPDRESAMRIGAASPVSNARLNASRVARELRQRIGGRSLESALEADLARARVMEVQGWVLPETLVLLCALAATVD